jgi:hypothetical protein
VKPIRGVDRRTIRILRASLDLDTERLANRMGYDTGYVANVLSGFADASPVFRRAFGETIGSLILGTHSLVTRESYPPGPLVALIESRAVEAPSKREFYRELGTSAQAIRGRKSFDAVFVDRVCCALGVHPSAVYGRDYDVEQAS